MQQVTNEATVRAYIQGTNQSTDGAWTQGTNQATIRAYTQVQTIDEACTTLATNPADGTWTQSKFVDDWNLLLDTYYQIWLFFITLCNLKYKNLTNP